MKVKELIEQLKKCDPEKMVVKGGYEGGYEDVVGVSEIRLRLNVHSESYYGPHDEHSDGDCHAILIRE